MYVKKPTPNIRLKIATDILSAIVSAEGPNDFAIERQIEKALIYTDKLIKEEQATFELEKEFVLTAQD